MITTTGSTIENYMTWVRRELDGKQWGEVTITFVVTKGQVTDVRRTSIDTEHLPLAKQS